MGQAGPWASPALAGGGSLLGPPQHGVKGGWQGETPGLWGHASAAGQLVITHSHLLGL